jgi:hypothetical protein
LALFVLKDLPEHWRCQQLSQLPRRWLRLLHLRPSLEPMWWPWWKRSGQMTCWLEDLRERWRSQKLRLPGCWW